MRRYKYKNGELYIKLHNTLKHLNDISSIEELLFTLKKRIDNLEEQYNHHKEIATENDQLLTAHRKEKQNIYLKIQKIKSKPENRKLWGWGGLNEDSNVNVNALKSKLHGSQRPNVHNSVIWSYKEKQELYDLKQARKISNEKARALKKKQREKESKIKAKKKANAIKARIASHEKKSRHIASSVKKNLKITDNCPYCNKAIGESPHADHIYPVSKGGQSIDYNMVFICKGCNLLKSDMTLREFITKARLDRDSVERRLDDLNKRF